MSHVVIHCDDIHDCYNGKVLDVLKLWVVELKTIGNNRCN